jgi:hypothetical protein
MEVLALRHSPYLSVFQCSVKRLGRQALYGRLPPEESI